MGGRNRNRTVYAGGRVDWGAGLKTGLDVLRWKTDYAGAPDGDLLRFDLCLKLDW